MKTIELSNFLSVIGIDKYGGITLVCKGQAEVWLCKSDLQAMLALFDKPHVVKSCSNCGITAKCHW